MINNINDKRILSKTIRDYKGATSVSIYLYVKTHKVTGLKYLGMTTQDPHKYPSSGVYWSRHLKEHGDEVDTEVLHECQTNADIRELGLHYSTLWDVVNARI